MMAIPTFTSLPWLWAWDENKSKGVKVKCIFNNGFKNYCYVCIEDNNMTYEEYSNIEPYREVKND